MDEEIDNIENKADFCDPIDPDPVNQDGGQGQTREFEPEPEPEYGGSPEPDFEEDQGQGQPQIEMEPDEPTLAANEPEMEPMEPFSVINEQNDNNGVIKNEDDHLDIMDNLSLGDNINININIDNDDDNANFVVSDTKKIDTDTFPNLADDAAELDYEPSEPENSLKDAFSDEEEEAKSLHSTSLSPSTASKRAQDETFGEKSDVSITHDNEQQQNNNNSSGGTQANVTTKNTDKDSDVKKTEDTNLIASGTEEEGEKEDLEEGELDELEEGEVKDEEDDEAQSEKIAKRELKPIPKSLDKLIKLKFDTPLPTQQQPPVQIQQTSPQVQHSPITMGPQSMSANMNKGETRPEDVGICKFYIRGQCTWANFCKFLHPGHSTIGSGGISGDRNMGGPPFHQPPFEGQQQSPRFQPKQSPTMGRPRPVSPPPAPMPGGGGGGGAGRPMFRLPPPPVPPAVVLTPQGASSTNQPESAWERGIKQARALMKKGEKKDTDGDDVITAETVLDDRPSLQRRDFDDEDDDVDLRPTIQRATNERFNSSPPSVNRFKANSPTYNRFLVKDGPPSPNTRFRAGAGSPSNRFKDEDETNFSYGGQQNQKNQKFGPPSDQNRRFQHYNRGFNRGRAGFGGRHYNNRGDRDYDRNKQQNDFPDKDKGRPLPYERPSYHSKEWHDPWMRQSSTAANKSGGGFGTQPDSVGSVGTGPDRKSYGTGSKKRRRSFSDSSSTTFSSVSSKSSFSRSRSKTKSDDRKSYRSKTKSKTGSISKSKSKSGTRSGSASSHTSHSSSSRSRSRSLSAISSESSQSSGAKASRRNARKTFQHGIARKKMTVHGAPSAIPAAYNNESDSENISKLHIKSTTSTTAIAEKPPATRSISSVSSQDSLTLDELDESRTSLGFEIKNLKKEQAKENANRKPIKMTIVSKNRVQVPAAYEEESAEMKRRKLDRLSPNKAPPSSSSVHSGPPPPKQFKIANEPSPPPIGEEDPADGAGPVQLEDISPQDSDTNDDEDELSSSPPPQSQQAPAIAKKLANQPPQKYQRKNSADSTHKQQHQPQNQVSSSQQQKHGGPPASYEDPKTVSSRREELLKQLKAVEDAIAKKRSKAA